MGIAIHPVGFKDVGTRVLDQQPLAKGQHLLIERISCGKVTLYFMLVLVGWLVVDELRSRRMFPFYNTLTIQCKMSQVCSRSIVVRPHKLYSLRPKMIVSISNFGEIKDRSPLSEYDAQNRKHQLLRNTPGSCGV